MLAWLMINEKRLNLLKFAVFASPQNTLANLFLFFYIYPHMPYFYKKERSTFARPATMFATTQQYMHLSESEYPEFKLLLCSNNYLQNNSHYVHIQKIPKILANDHLADVRQRHGNVWASDSDKRNSRRNAQTLYHAYTRTYRIAFTPPPPSY
jgi:hypothetical protein